LDDGVPGAESSVAAARRVATDLLDPRAAAVDAGQVPRSHLAALGEAGLLGLHAPAQLGGAGATLAQIREVAEILAGADLATWFVQAQHHSPVRMLLRSGADPVLLAELVSGRRVAGIAFSHLRRWPQRPLTATRVAGGWRLDGTAPWYTGWGVNDLAVIGGVTQDGTVVFGAVDAVESPHLHAGATMELAALESSATVALTLTGLHVAEPDAVLVQPIAEWAAADDAVSVNVVPAVFGVAASAGTVMNPTRSGRPTSSWNAWIGRGPPAIDSSTRSRCTRRRATGWRRERAPTRS
jgi:alkylation response protein AidB-like acyl-CoA dehydrogenase